MKGLLPHGNMRSLHMEGGGAHKGKRMEIEDCQFDLAMIKQLYRHG